MGTWFHLVVVADPGQAGVLADTAEEQIRDLDRRWSRFRPAGELTICHRHAGNWVQVSAATLELVDRAQFAWSATGGRFDPTLLDEVRRLGYDRSFEAIGRPFGNEARCSPIEATSLLDGGRVSRCGDIELDRRHSAVKLPAGVGFDAGGIGKGFAADRVTADVLDRGASGVLVNLGGDLRVRGTPPAGATWSVLVREPSVHDGPLARIALIDGAVATSTSGRRRWTDVLGVQRHHVLDPVTGVSTSERPDDVVLATTIAGSGWWAEAAATASIGRPTDPLVDVHLLTLTSAGTIRRSRHFDRFER